MIIKPIKKKFLFRSGHGCVQRMAKFEARDRFSVLRQ